MAMTLYCKRAKCFVQSDEAGTKKFLLQAGPSPQPVPNWVADTPTFKQGVKDGSIVNLTPPHLMPGYKVPVVEPVAEAAKETEEPVTTVAADEEAELEQKEVPQAPFGAQPMTPVTPAPRVGSVRAAGGRGGK